MCGFTGIFNFKHEAVTEGVLSRMADAIAHRGPDGAGMFTDERYGVGHRRLAILDTSDLGIQPMTSSDGNWVVAFNGCIYNFRELRSELIKKGSQFKSQTDTEIISEGLVHYGESIFQRFNGMFAIAAYNKYEKRLLLSRDKYGVKPLYYYQDEHCFLFGSEIKAIIQHPAFRVELNYDALSEYFTFQNLFENHTLFKGVRMLPAACTMEISDSHKPQVRKKVWWDFNFSDPDESMSFEEAKEETVRLFTNAVKRQLIADVPVGAYLSGGMDSGSITAIASSQIKRLTTFTAGFDMSSVTGVEANFDERRDAELMANHYKTEHYEQVINAGDLAWSLPRVVWHLEDLKVGMSYPNYYVSRLASKFVKVCLQGTGGDELYGGYPWRYYRVFHSLDQQSFFDNYFGFWQRLVSDSEKKELFAKSVLDRIDIGAPKKIFEKVFTHNKKLRYNRPEDHIANSLYFEIKTFLPGLLLVGDKLSMANGLEERFPFLDDDLVNLAQRIPVKHKLANLELRIRLNENEAGNKKKHYQEHDDGKTVLRKAMMDFLPERIVNRKKQGFSAPDESWYRGENAQYIKDLLLNKKAVYSEFINRKFVEKIIDEHINQRINHRLLIWSLMNFEIWCQIFLLKKDYRDI